MIQLVIGAEIVVWRLAKSNVTLGCNSKKMSRPARAVR
jgi:hypothetical protein